MKEFIFLNNYVLVIIFVSDITENTDYWEPKIDTLIFFKITNFI